MSYETAPATVMLASHCAVCGRPLVDSVSVETGVGPDCRKRYGYGRADREVDFATVLETLDSEIRVLVYGSAGDTQKAANRLVYEIARDQSGPKVNALTNAVAALGFDKLASRIGKRLAAVSIVVSEDGASYLVKTPYSDAAVEAWRAMGRRLGVRLWDKAEKANRVPVTARKDLWETLIRLDPGATALINGEKLVTIPGKEARA